MTSRGLLGFLAAIALPLSAQAQSLDDIDARMCRNGLFGDDAPFQLARVTGDRRAYFLTDMAACPDAGECREIDAPYVVPGDELVVSKLRTGHACAYFSNGVGGTAGYLPLDQLELIDVDAAPPVSAWTGEWSHGNNPLLTIVSSDDGLVITGEAYWPARREDHDYPMSTVGSLEGRLTIFGNRAIFNDGDCRVDFTLLGDTLVAGDNRRCGGMNISFTDVYRRSGA